MNEGLKNICILDYGSGNTRSVFNMVSSLEKNTKISNEPSDIENATHLILPGVGAFGASMQKVREKIPIALLEDEVLAKGKPFLGICVGMQLLADVGYEFGEEKGLGWIKGSVRKIEAGSLPLPHVGWNNVACKASAPVAKDFAEDIDFYFVHSYVFVPEDAGVILGTTRYGENFCSMLGSGNIFGVQFHPEKSQRAGIQLFTNFLEI